MTRADLLAFMRAQRLAVQATTGPAAMVQAAVVGIAVTESLEIVFDTLRESRKVTNLRAGSAVAFVLGGLSSGEERTVQYEGIADEPTGEDLVRLRASYLAVWPDGLSRQSWPGLIYIRVRPTWIRYSDFSSNPATIVEFSGQQLK